MVGALRPAVGSAAVRAEPFVTDDRSESAGQARPGQYAGQPESQQLDRRQPVGAPARRRLAADEQDSSSHRVWDFLSPNDVEWNLSPNNDIDSSFTNPFNGTLDGSLTPNDTLKNPFPNGLLQVPGRSPNYQQLLYGQGPSAPILNQPHPTRSSGTSMFSRNCPGTRRSQWLTQDPKARTCLARTSTSISFRISSCRSVRPGSTNRFRIPSTDRCCSGLWLSPMVAYGQLLRPYPQYTGFSMANPTNRNSIYHSLQVKAEKRFGRGGTLLGSYTWSKLISDTDTITGWLEPGGGAGGAQDNYNIRAERPWRSTTRRIAPLISYIVDMPFGKGQPFAQNVHGVADKLIPDGASMARPPSSPATRCPLASPPIPTVSELDSGPTGLGPAPNIDGSAQSRLNQWFNTSAFSLPGAFTFGNSARTLPDVRGHGINNFDFTVFKNTTITERVGLQFRTEIFNLFNRVQFGYPGLRWRIRSSAW